MKKIYLTCSLVASCLSINAQTPKPQATAYPVTTNLNFTENPLAKTTASVMILPGTFGTGGCATNSVNIKYYSITQHTSTAIATIDDRGYMFGTNTYSYMTSFFDVISTSSEAAQKYNVTGNVMVTQILVATPVKASDAGTSLVSAKLYSEDPSTKGPDVQLGGTGTKALNSFSETGLNTITFPSPISVPDGNFFAAIQSPAIGGSTHDTLAIASTAFGCASADSLSWQYWDFLGLVGYWQSVKSYYGNTSAHNLDLLIFPVVDIPSGLNAISKGDLTLLSAFPNPAINEVSIHFGLSQPGKVMIEVYDVAGKLVKTTKLDQLEAGNHSSTLDIAHLTSGVYLYAVKSNTATLYSKFTLSK